jgi:hypothetical protein
MNLFKKILSLALMFIFVSMPFASYAQTVPPRAIIVNEGQTYQPARLNTSQANSANSNTTAGSFGMSGSTYSTKFAACIGAAGITTFVKNQIASIVGSVTGGTTRVPTGNAVIEGKETGSFLGISWDQLGWCMVNSLIAAIGAATVAWINSGFQGNPVFVTDPGQFFADVADQQAGIFLDQLTNGFLCSPIKNLVRVNLANSYNGSINPYGQQCTFSNISEMNNFMQGAPGSFNWLSWSQYTQNPDNNPVAASIKGQIVLDSRIAQTIGLQQNQLAWGKGFLSSKDPVTGKITSPGSVIEKQINDRLGSGQRRLEIADEFDEVVNALVNQLIKVAISEMTGQTTP